MIYWVYKKKVEIKFKKMILMFKAWTSTAIIFMEIEKEKKRKISFIDSSTIRK